MKKTNMLSLSLNEDSEYIDKYVKLVIKLRQ